MNQKIFERRVYITGLLVMGIAFFFVYRLIDLHFSDRIWLTSTKEMKIRRGWIKDRNGSILAMSIERYSLFVNPEEVENPEEIASILSPKIGLSENYILRRVTRKKRFVWLKRKLDDSIVEIIKRLAIKGLYFRKEFHRVYPQGKLASNIIGFVGIDNIGLGGIEYRFDRILSGRLNESLLTKEGKVFQGDNITLTIDRFIQYIAEREIKNCVRKVNARRGVSVVFEIKTGRLLAIAKYPNFDPNYYNKYSDDDRKNFTVIDSFEPGSTLKVIALAAILQHAPDTISRRFQCNGSIKVADTTIRCTEIHNQLNLYDIIKYSCNVGVIQAIKNVKNEDFYNVLMGFGFGKRVSSEILGESDGILRPIDGWSGLSKYSISIGHEISVTSIQLVSAFGAIANEGVYLVPTIIESIEKSDGSILKSFCTRTRGRILSRDISNKILKIMKGVVDGGTGGKAFLEYYNVCGKTGTSQKSMRRGGYYPNKYIASFIGIAPMENPDLCLLVVIDEPEEGSTGGRVAAPVFARIASQVLPYRGIKALVKPALDPMAKHSFIGKFDGISMLDFRGLLLSESLKLLIDMQKKCNITYSIIGHGRVYRQYPKPNARIAGNQKISLYLR